MGTVKGKVIGKNPEKDSGGKKKGQDRPRTTEKTDSNSKEGSGRTSPKGGAESWHLH